MTRDKAIKVLTHYKVEGEAPCPPALDDALQQGIEALEFIERNASYLRAAGYKALPGD